jgi:Phage terminase, small subunit
MPRKSAAALSVVPPVSGLPSRLSPPADLGERERAIWLDIIGSLPPHHFIAADGHLLARYVEAAALAETAAAKMRKGAVVKGELSAWVKVHAAATKTMAMMTVKLRLSPASRMPNRPTRSLSYYERQALDDRAPARPPSTGKINW